MIKLALLLLLTLLTPTTLEKPIAADVFLQGATTHAPSEKVSGLLLRYDADTFVLTTAKGERDLAWTDLTPSSAFTLRSRLMDTSNAGDWIELGQFGWGVGAKEQARAALAQAVKLDPALRPRVTEILKTEPGRQAQAKAITNKTKIDGATTHPVANSNGGAALTSSANAGSPSDAGAIPVQPGRNKGQQEAVVRYQPVSAEEAARAISDARANANEVSAALGVKFIEIQTAHFILFTDWDPLEYDFLKTNVEGAYAAVSKAFEMPVKDNIFAGKLAVFMIVDYKNFESFAKTYDNFPVTRSTAGYYSGAHGSSLARMVMWKPVAATTGGDISRAERLWASVLTHEFTHAFIARYRTNQVVPRWLNEGTAEVVANGQFPGEGVYRWAHMMASINTDIEPLFDDNKRPGGEAYPIMMTMVEALLTEDRRKFLNYFNSIKDGKDPEQALKDNYGVDNEGLAAVWKKYALGLK